MLLRAFAFYNGKGSGRQLCHPSFLSNASKATSRATLPSTDY